MSVTQWKRAIGDGDLVIFYENFNKMQPVVVRAGQIFNNRFGHFYHSDLIGKPFGTKLFARKGAGGGNPAGFVTCLHPTAELWTSALKHRTQILYIADISMILLGLNVRPGAVVVESGTGSGSLSTSFARSVAPTGHVHTFEFNAARVSGARADFARTGVDGLISVYHRNVCARGFPVVEGGVDAVFLDLPTPWEVVDSANRILVPSGRFCSFSPCIEQVQRTCLALRNAKFTDIRTIECLLRTFDVHADRTEPAPIDPALLLPPSAAAGAAVAAAAPGAGAGAGEKRARDDAAPTDADAKAKKQKTGADTAVALVAAAAAAAPETAADDAKGKGKGKGKSKGKAKGKRGGGKSAAAAADAEGGAHSGAAAAAAGAAADGNGALAMHPFPVMRGHTGYLTFAVRHHLPFATDAEVAAAAVAAASTPAALAAAKSALNSAAAFAASNAAAAKPVATKPPAAAAAAAAAK